jgi:putative phosphonate metabolism protein
MPYGGSRFAIYFAPDPASALWRFGSSCMSYDASLALGCDPLIPTFWSEDEWWDRTEEPRRYGFHATLKAPFHLREDVREEELFEAFDEFASVQKPFVIDGLRVACLGTFVALVPVGDVGKLNRLAADSVRAFDKFRAPLSPEDFARRLSGQLTPRQKQYVEEWGYPYVLEEFRFHMTLTGPLASDECLKAERELKSLFAASVGPGPVAIDSIALFRQDRRDGRFRIIRRAPLLAPRNAPVR